MRIQQPAGMFREDSPLGGSDDGGLLLDTLGATSFPCVIVILMTATLGSCLVCQRTRLSSQCATDALIY